MLNFPISDFLLSFMNMNVERLKLLQIASR